MEQADLLLFPQSSEFSTDTVNFGTLTDIPGDSLVLKTVEEGSLTLDGDFMISKSMLLDRGPLLLLMSTVSVVVSGSNLISLVSLLTFIFPSKAVTKNL